MSILDDFGARQLGWQQERLYQLDELLRHADPRLELRTAYQLPYYYLGGSRLFFLNCPAHPGGPPLVQLGFASGYLLVPMPGILVGEELKQVRYLVWYEHCGHADELVLALVQESILILEASKLR